MASIVTLVIDGKLEKKDLIWSRMVRDYLLGQRHDMFELMALNVDSTRMPYRMHSEYLRKLFLGNQFARGTFEVDGAPIMVSDIHEPAFLVATVNDHISPWRSVYRFNLSSDTEEVTFLLSSGGHNAGIVSQPGHPRGPSRFAPERKVKNTSTRIPSGKKRPSGKVPGGRFGWSGWTNIPTEKIRLRPWERRRRT